MRRTALLTRVYVYRTGRRAGWSRRKSFRAAILGPNAGEAVVLAMQWAIDGARQRPAS